MLVVRLAMFTLVAGAIGIGLNALLGQFVTTNLAISAVLGIVGVILAAFLKPHSKFDNMNWFDALSLLFGALAVSQAIVFLVPDLGTFVLSATGFTWAAGGWLFVQLMAAEAIVSRFTKRK